MNVRKLKRIQWLFNPVVFVLLLAQPGTEAAQETGHQGHLALAGTVSRELMERPVALTDAPGHLHQPVSTESAEAQAYYDQGIAYLASYVWIEAARAFHEALRRDPELAMAHLGLAKAYAGADALEEARQHFAQAQKLVTQGKVTPKEAKWIALGVQQMDAIQAPLEERTAKHLAYKQALDSLIALDPEDPFAWILRGNAEEAGAWGRGQAGMTSSMRYYETALQHDPDNLAAHHFLVHSYENTGEHATAAEHARIYATAAAGVPHAHHMYGHILPRLGNWQEALAQLTEADRLERAYYAALGIAPEEDWHHGHNLHLLGTVCLRLGNDKEAERLFQEAFNLQSRGPLADRYSAPWIEYLLLRGRFDEALKAALEVEKRATPLARVVGPALAGEALVARGRLNEAKRAQKRAEAAVQQAIDATAHSPYETFTPYFVQPFLDTLAGELALRRKDPSLGEMQYLAMADALVVNPRLDAWAEGLFRLERLAIDARRAGRPKLAQALVERMKKLDPDFTSSAVAAK